MCLACRCILYISVDCETNTTVLQSKKHNLIVNKYLRAIHNGHRVHTERMKGFPAAHSTSGERISLVSRFAAACKLIFKVVAHAA